MEKGPLALKRTFQPDVRHKNRTTEGVEEMVIGFSLINPHLGQAQVSAQLKTKYDIEISPAGVRYIWLRENMNTYALRALKAKSSPKAV